MSIPLAWEWDERYVCLTSRMKTQYAILTATSVTIITMVFLLVNLATLILRAVQGS